MGIPIYIGTYDMAMLVTELEKEITDGDIEKVIGEIGRLNPYQAVHVMSLLRERISIERFSQLENMIFSCMNDWKPEQLDEFLKFHWEKLEDDEDEELGQKRL